MRESKTWFRIAACGDIPLREGRAVKIGSREIAIFNLGERFLAVENRCPHRSGPLADGMVSGMTVVCPLHAWKFNLESGESLSGAGISSCVETFRTVVEDGTVLLELTKYSRASVEPDIAEIPTICIERNKPGAVNDMPAGS